MGKKRRIRLEIVNAEIRSWDAENSAVLNITISDPDIVLDMFNKTTDLQGIIDYLNGAKVKFINPYD